MSRRSVLWAVGVIVTAFVLAMGIEVCALLPYVTR